MTSSLPNYELLTMDEAAKTLRKTPAAMRWMRHNGTGPKSGIIGGRVMYRRTDIDAYVAAAFDDDDSDKLAAR